MPSRSARLRTAGAALLTAGLAACGSGSDTAGGGTPSPTASRSTSAASSPSASPATPSATTGVPTSAGPGGAPGSAPPQGVVEGRLAGTGYAFTLPDGWEDATARFKEYSELIDAGAADATRSGQAFSDNVNVLRNGDQIRLPRSRAEQQFADELRTVASSVKVQPPASVGGVEAVRLIGRTDAGAVTAVTEQYVCFVDGAYYFITFAHGAATPPAQREQEVASVLTSWSWD